MLLFLLPLLVPACTGDPPTQAVDPAATLDIRVRFPDQTGRTGAKDDWGTSPSVPPEDALRGGTLDLDSVRTFAYELSIGDTEELRARASTAIQPGDERFSLSVRVPVSDRYRIVVQALGQDGISENPTERGILFQGLGDLSGVTTGPNGPIEIQLRDVVPDPERRRVGAGEEIFWDPIPELPVLRYEVEETDASGGSRILPVEAPAFPLEGRVGRVPTPPPAAGDSMDGLGETPPFRVYRVRSVLTRGFVSAFSETLRVPVRVPDAVDDLRATIVTTSSITLEWTASGDDGDFGQASSYDLRWSLSPIPDLDAFDTATPVTGEPTPAPAGAPETLTLNGLDASAEYHLALRVADEVDNISPISNRVVATTLDETPGACCTETGACSVVIESECTGAGETFQGAGTVCDPNPCPVRAACCFPNGSCLVLDEDECLEQGGERFGEFDTCDPTPCPQPEAGCCFEDGSCGILVEAECLAEGGDWMVVVTSCDPNPCPAPVRACCFSDGSCVLGTEDECENTGATWLPNESACEPNPCPQPMRACCLPDRVCNVLTRTQCDAAGGDWLAGDDSCDPDPCPDPLAVCCSPNGACNLLTETNCLAIEGTWEPDLSSCAPDNPCPQPPARACCTDLGGCRVVTEAECVAEGDLWLPEEASCTPSNPCPEPMRACCLEDGTCARITEQECTDRGGIWIVEQELCDPNPCPQPAACCFADGSCTLAQESTCIASGGDWLSESNACEPNPCPQPTAVCCFTGGSCTVTTEAACLEAGGTSEPDLVSCDPNPCPQPTGACCVPDVSCQILTEAECTSAGGLWDGGLTSCSPDPCPSFPGACCASDGTCEVLPETACDGLFLGAVVLCSPNPCPVLPDLIVTQIEVDPLEPTCGQPTRVRARVRNAGTEEAPATTVRITVDGEEYCILTVPALDPNIQVATEYCDLGPLADGVFAVEACVDPDGVIMESDEGNNCDELDLELAACADLIVESIEFEPPEPGCEEPVQVRAVIRNDGAVASGAFLTQISRDGLAVCTLASSSLGPGASAPTDWCDLGLALAPIEVTVCADSGDEVPESNETDNCLDGSVDIPPCLGWSAAFGDPPSGNGLNNVVFTVFAHDGKVYVGGEFTSAGGVSAQRIAVWDGVSWAPMDSGMNGPVYAITEYDGLIVATGQFDVAGGVSVDNVAAWNGSRWEPMGNLPGQGAAAIVYEGELIVGGFIAEFNSLARWNGSFWSTFEGGVLRQGELPGVVYALEVYNGRLHVGGILDRAGGFGPGAIVVQNIAAWNGGSWEALGSGLTGDTSGVFALETHNGLLYAGGAFDFAGMVPAANVAAWSGTSWLELPGPVAGTDHWVWALQSFNGSLIVGGDFKEAGGTPVGHIARWTGSTWQPLDSGVANPGGKTVRVQKLTVLGSSLFAGGVFTEAGGNPSLFIARWDE